MSVKETEKHVEYSEFDRCSTPAARDAGPGASIPPPKAHDRRPKFSVQETRTRNSHEKLGPIYAHKTHKNLTRETWRLMIQTKTLWQSF